MVLDELHVLERRSRPVGQSHPVAGLDVGVGGERVDPAAASCAQDDRLASDHLDPARHQLDRHHAADPAVIDQQPGDVPLVVAADALVLERGLEEGVEHVEAGLVRGEPGAHLLHAAERPHRDVPVGFAAPGAAPVLEPKQLPGGFGDERLDGLLVAQPVPAGDSVVGMPLEAVGWPDDSGRPALGRHRVAAHRVNLRGDRHAQPRISLCDRDGGAQSGPTAAYHQDVMSGSSLTSHGLGQALP